MTAQVRSLKRRLDRQLFERLPHGVASTPFAATLAAQVAAPLDELAALTDPARGEPAAADPVHLAGPAELFAVRAVPALAPLTTEGVRLRITTGLADDLLEELRYGRYDLVVSAVRPRGRAIAAVPLCDEEFVLVAAPSWAQRFDPAAPDALPLVGYAEDLPIVRRYWRHVFGRRLAARPVLVAPDLRAVLAATLAGAGVTVLPRYLCAGELAAGRLVALLEPADPPINTLFLAQRAGAAVRGPVARVREALLREARSW